MANNKIQIKRSTANATVTGLSNGELAYTQNSHTLWIGLPDGSGVEAIGGQRNPGTLTANQAMVVNATSGIDKVIVANLVPTIVFANGQTGTAGQVLLSAGPGSNVYWGTGTSGANTQVQFNDSGVANGVAGFTFDKVSNTLFVGNNVYTTTVNATTVNAASHTVGTSLVANSTGLWTATGTVNAAVLSVGTSVVSNSSGVFTTGNVNGATISVGSTFVANSTTLNANGLIVNSTGAYVTGLVNATSYNAGATGTGAGGLVANSTAVFVGNNTINATITATTLTIDDTNAGVGLTANTTGLYTGVVNGSTISVGTAFIANSTKVTFTGANIDATSAFLKVADAVISGNLVVSGSVVSVNTSTLIVNDNIIELGDNNTTTDVVDTGFYSPAGNSTAIWYSGIARIAASSTNTNPVFKIFVSNINPNTATIIDTSANTRTGTLQAYLIPYGTGGALVANSSNVQITANSTLGVNITANTLALSTALAGTSGGTGKATVTNNALLVGNSTNGYNELTLGTSGYVLQSNGTAIVYDILDGGSF